MEKMQSFFDIVHKLSQTYKICGNEIFHFPYLHNLVNLNNNKLKNMYSKS